MGFNFYGGKNPFKVEQIGKGQGSSKPVDLGDYRRGLFTSPRGEKRPDSPR